MFNFNLKKAKIYQAVKWEKFSFFRFAKILKILFFVLFVLVFLAFLYGFVPENFSPETNRTLLGLSIIFLVSTLSSWIKESFFNLKLKKPELKANISEALLDPESYNLAEFLSFEAAKAVSKSKLSSTRLFYFILIDNPKLDFIFLRALLDSNEIKKILKKELKAKESDNFQRTILEALGIAQKKNHTRIEIGDVLSALAKHNLIFKRILVKHKLKAEDIENLTWWLENIKEKIKKRKRFWEYENLAKRGTLAKEWTAGYTIALDRYSKDLTDSIRKKDLEFVGHKEEMKRIERILARREINNVLIIGEPGTGKRSMVYALTQMSLLGRSLPGVSYKRVVELDVPALLAQLESMEDVEATLDKIFQEVVLAGNIILVIDGFHNYIGQVSRPGIIDISGVIAPYLRFPQFQIVAITTYEGLHRYIEKNPSILSLFGKVEVSGISQRETLVLLGYLTFALEKRYKIFISYPAMREIISLTDRYFPSLHFPEKAIDILDEVAVYVAGSTREKVVLPKHIAKIITEKTEIPVGEIEAKEREVLLNLENLIHQRIINQDEAVKEVSTALRRARSEVTVRKGSMGCFLFLGPTGVGKTETSKALAEYYFGSEKKMIRLDMSEFQDIKDIPRLIGSATETGLLTTPVRENPFSLILLDEIEKANHNILNLFLQVLDEGHLTDGFGRKVDFKNSIIIATSNAGYKVILEALKRKTEWAGVKQKLLDYLFEKRIFRPEFINRFDAVVVFRPLTKENLLDIAQLMLSKLKKNLQKKGIEFIITEPLKEKVVELGYSPVFGARAMRRVIQDKVENVLASALLSGQLKRGDRVELDPKKFKLIINP
ncbi:ATP-dependent Clp protease ATP-binding subunit [Patescibacteria group bacterium]|nr:ATP-dependent Clp protease ATP-binding subunit [Patescibacteria group bacterium]